MANIDKQRILESINSYRSKHSAPSVQWNDDLQNEAQNWSQHLANNGQFYHGGNNGHGQNLYMTSGQVPDTDCILDSIKNWYDENRYYNYSNPGFNEKTGHFTQLVWRNCKSIGAGVARTSHGTYVTMDFDPAGNITNPGEFQSNVIPPSQGHPHGQPNIHNLLGNDQQLKQGESLRSPNGSYHVIMQNDGNFVLYDHSNQPIWASNTAQKGVPPHDIKMQSDGNLVIYDGHRQAIWSSNTYLKGSGPYQLIIQDDRNLVIYDGHRQAIWSSGTYI